ncbi:AraC family transcriptional regulator [Limnobacter sp. 130]|uniref:helix-turn-helix domain-containing protein n=1 Tax=Limnobacter sp. 130 TaxID=2653147 RepID=UPI0012F10A88|nr:AraC family transcriptional regulator [Limnobacter sp. 130]VWX33597.1 AraC family transcriptional regulator [Limnobacter sp. 130]
MPQSLHDFTAVLSPALHPVYARLLCAELQRRGFAPADILDGLPLNWQHLHESNQFMSFDQMRQLIERGVQLSQCPWLGLEVGLRTPASAHGTLGAAMIASKNLPSAMLLLQRYAGLRQNLANLQFELEPDFAAVLEEWVDLGPVREYLHCQLLGGLVQLLTAMTGQELPQQLRIEWPFDEPAWAHEYQRIAQHNSFGFSQLRVVLNSTLVNSPSLAADDEALQRLLRDCDLQLQRLQQGDTLAQRVRMQLQKTEGPMPTLQTMAAKENLTERTFMRHLQAEGTSFQQLLDEVRQERACWLLANTHNTVEDIAYALGYEDASNFSRTFKRWCGQTPKAYRQEHSS